MLDEFLVDSILPVQAHWLLFFVSVRQIVAYIGIADEAQMSAEEQIAVEEQTAAEGKRFVSEHSVEFE